MQASGARAWGVAQARKVASSTLDRNGENELIARTLFQSNKPMNMRNSITVSEEAASYLRLQQPLLCSGTTRGGHMQGSQNHSSLPPNRLEHLKQSVLSQECGL